MHVVLVIAMMIAGKPHQTQIEVPSVSECMTEAQKFLDYALSKEDTEQAVAACRVVKSPEQKS